mmetsp:Transcript_27380/g.48776  ORF Transcript_27380/g.48776 Transcript_27380/m.48776 type:complete len:331 (+) Transcript_27380:196-1188(+)
MCGRTCERQVGQNLSNNRSKLVAVPRTGGAQDNLRARIKRSELLAVYTRHTTSWCCLWSRTLAQLMRLISYLRMNPAGGGHLAVQGVKVQHEVLVGGVCEHACGGFVHGFLEARKVRASAAPQQVHILRMNLPVQGITCGRFPEVAVASNFKAGATELREPIPAPRVVLDVEHRKARPFEVGFVRDVEPSKNLPLRNARSHLWDELWHPCTRCQHKFTRFEIFPILRLYLDSPVGQHTPTHNRTIRGNLCATRHRLVDVDPNSCLALEEAPLRLIQALEMGREVVARESLVYLAARQHFMFKPVLLGGTQRPRKTLQLLNTPVNGASDMQ